MYIISIKAAENPFNILANMNFFTFFASKGVA